MIERYTGDPQIIQKLGTNPEERGLTTAEFKAKFDQFAEEFVAWFNQTHCGEVDGIKADYATLLAGGTPTKLTLDNGWTGDLYVRRNMLGQVTIYGEVTSGTVTSGTKIASLPDGCKPASITHIVGYIGRTGVRTFTGLVVSVNNTLVIFEPASDILSNGWSGIRINATYQSEY